MMTETEIAVIKALVRKCGSDKSSRVIFALFGD
jgi:hypothetical protein